MATKRDRLIRELSQGDGFSEGEPCWLVYCPKCACCYSGPCPTHPGARLVDIQPGAAGFRLPA